MRFEMCSLCLASGNPSAYVHHMLPMDLRYPLITYVHLDILRACSFAIFHYSLFSFPFWFDVLNQHPKTSGCNTRSAITISIRIKTSNLYCTKRLNMRNKHRAHKVVCIDSMIFYANIVFIDIF